MEKCIDGSGKTRQEPINQGGEGSSSIRHQRGSDDCTKLDEC